MQKVKENYWNDVLKYLRQEDLWRSWSFLGAGQFSQCNRGSLGRFFWKLSGFQVPWWNEKLGHQLRISIEYSRNLRRKGKVRNTWVGEWKTESSREIQCGFRAPEVSDHEFKISTVNQAMGLCSLAWVKAQSKWRTGVNQGYGICN